MFPLSEGFPGIIYSLSEVFMNKLQQIFIALSVLIMSNFTVSATEETFSAGAVLLPMDAKPQTAKNTLQVYGLLYELLANSEVVVKWIINPEKVKDGVDFEYENKKYRSGVFLIPVSYHTEKNKKIFEKWKEKGVHYITTKESLTLPVFTDLYIKPKWTLDKENGSIAVPFFRAAGIPSEAYGGNKIKNWKNPQELGICDDIFVMPHADPDFESHKNLYFWNKNYKGAIWAGCHAASILENLTGKLNGKEGGENIQLNFLSAGFAGARSAGLLHYSKHRDGTPPYKNHHPEDPVAQYLGSPGLAHLNGSERIFLPKKINEWRSQTKVLVSDPDMPDIPKLSKGPAAISLYGHGFGDPKNGLVMYQAAHNIFGKNEGHIAALRMFFNWSFYATEIKRRENLVKFTSLSGDNNTVAAKVGDDLRYILNLNPINFDLDEYEIRREAKEQLQKIARFMQKNPEILIDIRSHTDSRANDSYNNELSENRVKATRDFLVENGVEANRISGRGYGETEPVNNCYNHVPCLESQHEANRRSEFILSIDCEVYNELHSN